LSDLRGRVSQVERAIDEAECKGAGLIEESRLSLELDDLCKKCDAAANALFATRRQMREQAESAAAATSTLASASASTSSSSSDGKDGDGGGGGGVEANDRDPVLRIEQSRAGICSTVWDSSIVLGRFFEEEDRRRPGCFRGQRVLELGAGCGLTGIVLARLGAHVVFTDLEPASIDLLERNALWNLGPSSSAVAAAAVVAAAGEEGSGGEEGCAVASSPSSLSPLSSSSWRVGRLQWGDDKGVIKALGGPFDIVVGADIMYVIESVAALADTLVVACASSRASSSASLSGTAGEAKEGGKVCGGEGDGDGGEGGDGDREGEDREGEDRGGRGGGRVYLAFGRNRRALESFMPLADPHFAFTPVASEQLHPMYQSPDINAVCLTPVQVAP
jgi:predicted nicotinamide N-methyase